MTARTPDHELDADLIRVTRELHDALMAARPFVAEELDAARGLLLDARDTAAILDRVDGALAESGELLAGVTS